jgi:hypothetical protein
MIDEEGVIVFAIVSADWIRQQIIQCDEDLVKYMGLTKMKTRG